MKLMTYNIPDGAVETLPQIIEIVNLESPDCLALNEVSTFANNNKILMRSVEETSRINHC